MRPHRRRRPATWIVGLAALIAVVPACTDGSSTSTDGRETVTPSSGPRASGPTGPGDVAVKLTPIAEVDAPVAFATHPVTGDLYIADVGQNRVEEVNFQPAGQGGQNYGWKFREGFERFAGDPGAIALTDPIHQYAHREGGCSVTGGYVYRGAALPGLVGAYVYGDYCSGLIWTLYRNAAGEWQNETLFSADANISSFGEDEAGELYLLDHGGAVYKLVGVPLP